MRYTALFLLLFYWFSGVSQERETEVIVDLWFEATVSYNEVLEQPNWIKYTIPAEAKNDFKRELGEVPWFTEDTIHTSDKDDYYNNPWDKGHGIPSFHLSYNITLMSKSYTYLNCWLQQERLNRGAIQKLERYIFKRLKGYRTVKIEAIFSDSSLELPSGATVPDGFKWTIWSDSGIEKYKFDNVADEDFRDNRIE